MKERIIDLGGGFWSIRGSFRLHNLVQIGTQASLVRLSDGRFVLLDAYTLPDDLLGQIHDLTSGGRDIDAIINVHPFHTIHVSAAHAQFPHARLYGTARHIGRASELPWQAVRVEDPDFGEAFAGELEFSIPDGVDFISANPNVHFSSALVYHPASKTIHADDTLSRFTALTGLRFHPTLALALKREPGAADRFTAWAEDLIERWGAARNICTAHAATLRDQDDLAGQLRAALGHTAIVRRIHRRRFG